MTKLTRSDPDPADLARRTLNGATWILAETVTSQGLSLLVFGVMARFLTPREFGLASICYVLINSFKIPFDGIATIVARKELASNDEFSTAFWITCAVASLSFIAIQALSFLADTIFFMPELGVTLRAMSIVVPVLGLGRTHDIWLQRHFMFRSLALRTICGAVVGGATGIAAATYGLGVWALVAQQVTGAIASFCLLWISCPWRPAIVFSAPIGREIRRSMVGLIGSAIAYTVNQNGDTLLIGLFFGPADVGLYSIAKRLRYALQSVAAAPVNGVTMPTLVEVQGNEARFQTAFLSATFLLLSVCAPVFIGAAVVSPDVLLLMFGPRWLASAPAFTTLMVGGLLGLAFELNNTGLFLRDRLNQTFYLVSGYTALSTLAFFAIFSRRPDCIALPFVVPYLVMLPCSVILLNRAVGLGLLRWLCAVAPPIIASAVMYASVVSVQQLFTDFSLVERLCLCVASGALIYGLTLYLLAKERVKGTVSVLKRVFKDKFSSIAYFRTLVAILNSIRRSKP